MATTTYTEIDLSGSDPDGDLTRVPSILVEVDASQSERIQVEPPGPYGSFSCSADQARTLAAALVAGAALLEVNA